MYGLCNKNSEEWLLWSDELSWKTQYPSLTLCFQNTVLNWIPLCWLWIGSIFYIPLLLKKSNVEYGCRGTWNIIKSIFVLLLLYKHMLGFCFTLGQDINSESPARALYLQPILSGVSSALLIYLNRLAFRKGEHTSAVLFIYWFIQFSVSVISTISEYQTRETGKSGNFRKFANTFELLLVFSSFIATCFSDPTVLKYKHSQRHNAQEQKSSNSGPTDRLMSSPELEASYLSKLTYAWFNALLYKGYKTPVTSRDLYELRSRDSCKTILPNFTSKWTDEIFKIQNQKPRLIRHTKRAFDSPYTSLREDERKPPMEYFTYSTITANSKPIPSLLRTMLMVVGYKYLIYGIIRILVDLLIFVQPQLLSVLIIFIQTTNDFSWHGYIIVLAMFAVAMLRTIVYQQYNHISNVLGMRLRSGLISFIYRKTLRLSPSSRQNTTLGEIINLMSVDSQKLTSLTYDLHSLIATPIFLLVGFYFLWQELGIATLSGIVFMLCIVPLNAIIGVKVKKLQAKQMELKDIRIKWMSELLSGIKVFKLNAWEKTFEDRLQRVRDEECRILRFSTYMNSLSAVSCFCAPYLIALVSFGTFILMSPNNILDVNKAFVSLALVNLLNTPMSYLSTTIAFVAHGYVSIHRVNKYLVEEELPTLNIKDPKGNDNVLEITDGTFKWQVDDNIILKSINISVSAGELIAVVGNVGSGKSSLMNAVLGEMYKVAGDIRLKGSVAYVPQQAWCLNATIQDNILFGKSMNVRKYKAIVDACALNPDLEILSDGDQTEVGEKGINLSGGQKQRISIARAVYQDASIYLLDDPLSAVDANVNRRIFDKVFGTNGILSQKTRILVTHDVSHLSKVDRIFYMKSGHIVDSGSYSTLLAESTDFADFIRHDTVKMDTDSSANNSVYNNGRGGSISQSTKVEEIQRSNHWRRRSSKASECLETESIQSCDASAGHMIKDEFIESGKVKMSVFIAYIRPATYRILFLVIATYFIYISSSVSGNVYLSSWSATNGVNQSNNVASRNEFLIVYGSLGVVQTVIILIENLCLAHGTFLASKSLHAGLLKTLLRVPNSFFETTPIGRILNRVGRDIDTVDINIPASISAWLLTASGVIGTIVVISIATPYFIIALLPLSTLYYFIQIFYISTNRQLKRIDAITRSPIYSHFHETITGASSIRAYKRSDSFIDRCDSLIDRNQMAWYLNIVSYRWLQFNLEFIGNLVILCSGLFAVVGRHTIGAGLAGLSVSYALQITNALNNMVRNTCDLESHVVSVERIEEYTTVKEEAPWIIQKVRPPHNWPSHGRIEFFRFSLKYRPELDFVLKNFSVVVEPGEKLGIVGRTGAGKSSLALALFRIIEPSEGSIFIDGIDIAHMGLHDLRSRLTIIPQDPVLFSGTLRMNLDPFDQYSDSEVWSALESAQMKLFVSTMPEGLQYLISENGDNISVGQKQLLCLARALLKKTKIIVMDEATAAIDLETDTIIQNSIRKQFKHCTVLTIAHRLNTIMDYDRILVLDNGQVKELGPPCRLLNDNNSLFFKLAKNAGLT